MLRFGIDKILKGDLEQIKKDYNQFLQIRVDEDCVNSRAGDLRLRKFQTTIAREVEVSDIGTFNNKKKRSLKFFPTEKQGWWFKRSDLSDSELIKVDCYNAWTSTYGGVNNIVLGFRSSDSFIRLTEHIIALKPFVGIDNLIIETESFDPPLFVQGSLDIFNALKSADIRVLKNPVNYYTAKEKLTMGWDERGFLIFSPPEKGFEDRLIIDCAIDYPGNAMGQERIIIPGDDINITGKGVIARTNSSVKHAILSKTIGKFFPTVRNLGYNLKNVLVVGRKTYFNDGRLIHNGKVLEPIWHRAVLDLLAAVALVGDGNIVGKLTSYKAGHTQDVEFFKEILDKQLLKKVS